VRIKLVEVNLKRGVYKREATACNYQEEEWPEEFIFHGAKDDRDVVEVMRGESLLPLSG
jgi:hypothetical protein